MLNEFRSSITEQIIYPLIDADNIQEFTIEVKRNAFAGPDKARVHCFPVYNATKKKVQIIVNLSLVKIMVGENLEHIKTSQYGFKVKVADGQRQDNLVWQGSNRRIYETLNKVFLITLIEKKDDIGVNLLPTREELRGFAIEYQSEEDTRK